MTTTEEAPRRAKVRVKTPTVLQMEATECGAASLGMVLAHHGLRVRLEELRAACGISRDGSNAGNIVKAARSYGLEAKAYRKEPEDLVELGLPQILFWEFNHFLVLEGVSPGEFHLNDPASGRRSVTAEEFDGSFTGVTITFQPGDEFEPGGAVPSLSDRLAPRLGRARGPLAYAVLAGLGLVVPSLVVPLFTKLFVDEVLVAQRTSAVGGILGALLVAILLIGGLTYVQQAVLVRLRLKLSLRMAGEFLWHVLRLPVAFYSSRSTADISWRVALNDRVADLLSGQLASNILNALTLLFYFVVMLVFDWVLALVAMGLASLNVVALVIVTESRKNLNQRLSREQAMVQATSASGIATIETLKSSGSESDFFERWAGMYAKLLNVRQDLEVSAQALGALPALLTAITTAAILGLGGLRVIDGVITLGTLVAFTTLLTLFLRPFTGFVQFATGLQDIEGALHRLDDVLDSPLDPAFSGNGIPPVGSDQPKLAGHVKLRDVSFGYSPLTPPLIEGFDIVVRPGQRVALVGPSGSGKSTTARVVTGLYPAWGGEVLIDGRPRQDIPRPVLADSVALVDQSIVLFPGTIRDNITLWDPTIPDHDVVQAAKDAGIHDDITARSGGYLSMVAEGGSNFSGGQRQRLEFARALARNPSILILDEATSALDPVTELAIDRALRRRGCTCVIIAHRLSTIRDADEIIVLDQGDMVQRGTHEELMGEPEGLYARLVGGEH